MFPRRIFPCAVGAALLGLSACQSVPPATGDAPPPPAKADLAQVKMPVLRSSHFDRHWGLPEVTVRPDGSYRLFYRQGTTLNFVIIHGLTQAKPVPPQPPAWQEEVSPPDQDTLRVVRHPQQWRHTTILGTPVKWFQNDGGSGADFPCYKTTDFTLTAPDGRTGAYRVEVCSASAADAADWIKRVNW